MHILCYYIKPNAVPFIGKGIESIFQPFKNMQNEGRSKVLIVDDEPDVCFLFGKILKMRNLRTDFANNLADASRSVQEDPPSVIFLDNSLPDGQGIDFISFLKERYPDTRIIIITANDGSIGYSVDAYGALSNHDDVDYNGFIVKVPVEEREEQLLFAE